MSFMSLGKEQYTENEQNRKEMIFVVAVIRCKR